MSVSLAVLVERLTEDVTARDGVPSETQYERAVTDAVADYSRRLPMQRMTTVEVVSGTAIYYLPSDFLRVIKLEALTTPDGVIISNEGLIPVSASYEERWMVAGRTIRFSPTPTYTLERDLWYMAGHVLDEDDEYPDMTEEETGIVLLKARSLALGVQANAVAGDGWMYRIGDEQVDKRGKVENTRLAAKAMEEEYLRAVEEAVGAQGVRADYNALGY